MNRRDFTKSTGLGILAFSSISATTAPSIYSSDQKNPTKVPLGIGNHSLRAIKPNAIQLLEYAIENKLDSVQFNTLKPFESLKEDSLKKVKKLAHANDISIYIGVGSIC